MELQGLHGQVVDLIGRSLAAEETRAGEVLRLEDVQDRYDVSRTVAREAVRVLESKRVVTSRPRIGITVRPPAEWNLYDPQVIRWRLASPARAVQLRELAELRAAVEPAAAVLAAQSADTVARREALGHAHAMADAAGEGNAGAFVAADTAFHRTLLRSSGNRMFAQLAEATEELLHGRRDLLLMPDKLDDAAVASHLELAEAVAEGRAAEAAACMRAILEGARTETEELL
ncbi:FCD domain-containing protein [Streptomyces sp. SID10853]|uniref:FCD domain-containing protein n=1 Tax=Streptomyces sp. SID10853 TaxID=2706028 RepID=UPI001944B196